MPILSGNAEVNGAVIAGNDGDFADRILATPMKATGQYGGAGVDPDRGAFEFSAPLRTDPSTVDIAGPGRRLWASEVPAGKTLLTPDPAAYPAVLTLRPGDRLKALDRNGQPEYSIDQIDPTGRARVFILLTRI